MPRVSGKEWNWTLLRSAWTMLRWLSRHNDTSPHQLRPMQRLARICAFNNFAAETMASVVALIIGQLYAETAVGYYLRA
jgi:hypothetical protein